MLKITMTIDEMFDEESQEFLPPINIELHLEHSLVSISKWEALYSKPFLTNYEKTYEETLDYIKCMNVDDVEIEDYVYRLISPYDMNRISEYIQSPMTATTINRDDKKGGPKEIITSEIIYYWMVSYNIPFECQYWHLNRLITLVNVISIKNEPPKKMSKKDLANRNRALNASRKKQFNNNG